MRANWDRLDPAAPPARIARALLALNGLAPDGPSQAGHQARGPGTTGPRRPGPRSARAARATSWPRTAGTRRSVRSARSASSSTRIDPKLAERLTRVLYGPLIRAASQLDYRRGEEPCQRIHLCRRAVADRPALEPPLGLALGRAAGRARRGGGLLAEVPQGPRKPARPHARGADAGPGPGLETPRQTVRRRRRGAGRIRLRPLRAPGRTIAKSRTQGIKRSPASRRACGSPPRTAPPTTRCSTLTRSGINPSRPRRSPAACWRSSLTTSKRSCSSPSITSGATIPSRRWSTRSAPGRSSRSIEAAAQHEWAVHVLLSRHLAFQGCWDEGRAEFAAAERVWPEWNQTFHFLARQAVFELKAGQADRRRDADRRGPGASRRADPALARPADRGDPVQAAARRTGNASKRGGQRALTKRRRTETAGALADLMTSFVKGDFDYPGRAEHLKQVVGLPPPHDPDQVRSRRPGSRVPLPVP